MKKPAVALALTSLSALALAGCSAANAQTGAEADGIQVVATTNVYGSLMEQIGGDRVTVTSIISSATQDPHSYEASARDRLSVENADLVVMNGGGYDGFMETLLDGSDTPVLTAVELSDSFPGNDNHADEATDDHDHAEDDHSEEEHAADAATGAAHDHTHIEGFNEHVWFDPHTMTHVVEEMAHELGALDPDGAADFDAAAAEIITELEGFEADLEQIGADAAGASVFVTEPLPGYIAAAAGLTNVTPEGFAEAVEEGSDVAPATLLAALDVIASGDVDVILTNAQTGGAETDRVEAAAEDAGIPNVAFTELLPDGSSYAEWMRDGIQNLADALQQ